MEGRGEVMLIEGGERRERRNTSGGGEDFGFSEREYNAEGSTKVFEGMKEEGEVGKGE